MLVELRAENYAVIDHAIAVFGPGLNLLTGETGAGKSILVDALALLMGGKASAEVVRHGAEKAVVACVFESTAGAETILEENGIDADGSEIILRREILATGKGRVFVNNQPATVAVLKLLAPELALVHAQSESLSSFDQAQQRILLDRFGGLSTEAVGETFARWRSAAAKLDAMVEGEQDRLRMVDLWSYQQKEIAAAHLVAGEDEALETEKRVLANAEKLYAAAMGAFEQLYEGGASAEVALRAAARNVEELARYDGRFAEAAQQLESARATLGDLSASLRDYAEGIDASPERLAEIEDRLALLDRLKRKYGKTVAEVIAFGEEVERKLAEVEDRDEILKALRAALDEAATAYRAAASALSSQRKAAARKLAKLAEAQINALAMKARFEIAVHSAEVRAASAGASSSVAEAPVALKGHDLSRAANAARGGGALQAQEEPGFVSGHDFSRAASGAIGGWALQAGERPGFVSGHDFSRTESSAKGGGALQAAEKPSFVSGHDFSRTESSAKGGGALQAQEEPGFVSGHDFSRAASGAIGGGALQAAEKPSFVSGHDFSRAANAAKDERALAPEGSSSETARWTSSGWDQVEYRIATNPGEPLKTLDEIASGGEMSRVMLALKVTVEEGAIKPKTKPPTPRTLVFDEIDIGIGGRAAEAVGQKLKSLGRGQQVLCVTHLPQIAAFADQHFLIDKREADGRTKMQIRLLDDRARMHEVARMVSGAKVTETSLQHAAQMIAGSR